MKKEIKLGKKNISYELRLSPRARHLRLAIYGDGTLVVTAPAKMPFSDVEKFIVKKTKWVLAKLEYFKKHPRLIKKRGSKKDYLDNKDKALELVSKRLEYFNKFYGLKYKKVSIKNQKTRWGSCSRRGNLNFNYKIIFLSAPLFDYVVVHELCHLAQLNHSPSFWREVAKTLPDYLSLRRELRKIGAEIG